MKAAVLITGGALLLGLGWVPAAEAQLFGGGPAHGNEIASFNFKLGLLAPQTSFDDPVGGTSSFDSGLAIGAGFSTWPMFNRRLGIRGGIVRSQTDGQNSTSDLAPIAVNDPNVYLYTLEAAFRMPMGSGFPYVSAGYGGKHYTWAASAHKVSRFSAFTAAAGYEMRPHALGPFGLNLELRGYQSNFRAFGIDDGTFEDGPLGGNIGGVKNLDLLVTAGFGFYF